jgi:hypothetical protein
MEPKLPASNRGPEQIPGGFNPVGEYTPSVPNPERPTEQKNETLEMRSEQQMASAASQAAVLPSVVQPPTPVVTSDADGAAAKALPLAAADDDLIEKEWVDKAKAVIAETKDDPYRREEEVAKLQIDYLRKRYGKELGSS